MELDVTVQDFIDTIKTQLLNEHKLIKTSDWTTQKSLKERESLHDLHVLLTDRAVKNAAKLYAMVRGDVSNKLVKDTINRAIDMFSIYNKRYESYVKLKDISKVLSDNEGEDLSDLVKKVEEEASFQSDSLNKINSMKEILRKINFGGTGNIVEVNLLNDTPAPFMMSNQIEERYPEVKKLIENKLDEKTKTKRVSK